MAKYIGFRKGTREQIKKGLFDKVKGLSRTYELLGIKNVKLAFRLFPRPPVDTGQTRRVTSAKWIWAGEKAILRFYTPNDVPRQWRVFPLLGLSTSKKYGERNWLMKGANLTLKELLK
jgi:hypothetical protein